MRKAYYPILLGGFLAILLISISYYKNAERRALGILEREGEIFLESLVRSSRNALKAEKKLEELLASDLLMSARLIDLLDIGDRRSLREIAYINDLKRIDIADPSGAIKLSTAELAKLPFPDDSIKPVLSGDRAARAFQWEGEYVVAVRREKAGGAVLVYKSIESLKRLEREIGIGETIKSMSLMRDIVYLLLQNEDGIIAATPNVSKMSRIESDDFLKKALAEKTTMHRFYEFNGLKVLETVKPFYAGGKLVGLFRLGLSLDGYRAILGQLRRQMAFVFVGFLLAFLLAFLLSSTLRTARRAELQVSEMTRREEETYETFPLGIIKIDRNLKVGFANSSALEIIKKDKSEVIGKSYREIFPDDELGIMVNLKEGKRTQKRLLITEDDDVRYIDIIVSPIGESVLVVLEDVTEKIRLEEKIQLSRQFEALRELSRGIAHEIRNPLNTVLIVAQRLEREFSGQVGDDEFSRLLETLKAESSRLEAGIRKLVDLLNPTKIVPRKDNFAELVREVIRDMEPEAKERNIVFKEDLDDLVFPHDREAMRQVLVNLFRNSFEAMEGGGEIRVSLKKKEGWAIITVSDTGRGIKSSDLGKIFMPHFTTKREGMGLGLALVKRVVEAHGGRIKVHSKPNEGATFIIEIPYG
ncbi:MAG: PAS domain-containing protein [Candidatus Hydrothermae bacterium]|nr:PAS domain-containing protein [Candidatus Hydrothermae bacterium]